jgi:hypothetical protein
MKKPRLGIAQPTLRLLAWRRCRRRFNAMGQQVYVDAEKVKESNKAL